MRSKDIILLILAIFFVLSTDVASAQCRSGEQTFFASGTAPNGVNYNAVSVNWDNGRIEVHSTANNQWVSPVDHTPADPDPGMVEVMVESLIHHEVPESSSSC
ncbi:MAG: hypothetical protein WDN24_14025 [Sphingomonas sp.]